MRGRKIHYKLGENLSFCNIAKNMSNDITEVTCVFCNKLYNYYTQFKHELGVVSDVYLNKKYGIAIMTVRKMRRKLNININDQYKTTFHENNDWKILSDYGLSYIEVNKSGCFRNVLTKKPYKLQYEKNCGCLFLLGNRGQGYRKFSAARLIYSIFHQTSLKRGKNISYKDGNPYNLNLDNLILFVKQKNPSRFQKHNLYREAIEWMSNLQPEDTLISLSKKLSKIGIRRLAERKKEMKRQLNIPTSKRMNTYEIAQLYIKIFANIET